MSSSYKPPASRMRIIKKNAPAPLPRAPATVWEALAQARASQKAGKVVTEVVVEAEGKKYRVTPGEDAIFGTADDVVEVTALGGEPLEDLGNEDGEDKPVYSMDNTKTELLVLVEAHGIDHHSKMNKATLIEALDAYFA